MATVTDMRMSGHDHDEAHRIATGAGVVVLEVFEDGVPPRFRLRAEAGPALTAHAASDRNRAARRRAPAFHDGGPGRSIWS